MVLSEIALGFLSNFGYEKSKEIHGMLYDKQFQVYEDAKIELVSKYSKLEPLVLDYFLDDDVVKDAIVNYFVYPDKDSILNVLTGRFIEILDESYFSPEDVKQILEDLIQIISNIIRHDSELREYLILYILEKMRDEQNKNKSCLRCFIPTTAFFAPYSDNAKLFNHTYSLVGRHEILEQLDNFIDSNQKIVLMPGRGGIGKSRILFEFGTTFELKHEEWELLFLNENALLSNDSIQELPDSKCVIVVDDAHRNAKIDLLLAISQQVSQPIKLILSFRSHGLDYLKSSYTKCGFDTREIEQISELQELTREDLEELGKTILGNDCDIYLEPLIQVAKDSTLAFVIGGKLISEEKVNPLLLERHNEFHDAVFQRFKDDLLAGVISDDLDKELCQNLLSLISLLSPIEYSNDGFKDKASSFLEIKKSKLIKAIDVLAKNGVLLRRGSKIRITPDVLSDYIAYTSCITPLGENTGFVEEVLEAFEDTFFGNLLYNIAELDWRISNEGHNVDLLDVIWKNVETAFRQSSNSQRCHILDMFEKIAYYQPKRVLDLIEYAVSNPSEASEQDRVYFYEYTHQDVVEKLPSLLRTIAYNFDYLRKCCELLWELGKDDERRINSTPNSAMRILIYLAKYDLYKPLDYNSVLLDVVIDKSMLPDVHEHAHSLLDIIDSLMGKDILHDRLSGFTLHSSASFVSYEKTEFIRSKAISFMEDILENPSDKVKLRALHSLCKSLMPPTGYYGRSVSEEIRDQWLPEQIKILDIIKHAVEESDNPILKIQVASWLVWHANHSMQANVAEIASSIISSVPEDSFEIIFTRAMWRHYERDYEDYYQHQEEVRLEIINVASVLVSKFNESRIILDILNEKLIQFNESGIEPDPREFLHSLAIVNYEISIDLCNYVISNPSVPLSKNFSSLVSGVRVYNLDESIRFIKSALESENAILLFSVSQGYGLRYWKWENADVPIIEQLITNSDVKIRELAIKSLACFSDGLRNEAIDFVLNVDIGENETLADIYCGIFAYEESQFGVYIGDISNEMLDFILNKLLYVKIFDSNMHGLIEFLTYCSNKIPEELVDFLLERIDLVQDYEVNTFRPLPFRICNEGLSGIQSSANYEDILRKVRDYSLKENVSTFWLKQLFAYISGDFCSKCLDILDEWISSNDVNKIKIVGLFLSEAPSDFIFKNSDYVSNLLENAQRIDLDCYTDVRSNILYPVFYGARSGVPGKPFREDEEPRDKSSELLEKYPKGSLMWDFYNYIFERANSSIKRTLDRDEEMYDD
ncbi:MAG: hypothetical protein PWQ50_1152 [Methanolobus sp.]|jgi:hypothetical protein|nr:hypothetical protein [Methanolobus sp.]